MMVHTYNLSTREAEQKDLKFEELESCLKNILFKLLIEVMFLCSAWFALLVFEFQKMVSLIED
jgi:hypothetical protein